MKYSEIIEKLTSNDMSHIDLGLDRIASVLKTFNNPQDKLKCIHVAGTNGKGSVCAMLDSILREAGYKTGLYTSPHIFEYTERIKINGKDISKSDFTILFENVLDKCNALNITLTEFEIITVIMFLYFYKHDVDYVILETGLGGRLDATNVISKNICSIITTIDFDHTDKLGNTKKQIACEKAGIIKQNCPIITSMKYKIIKDKAKELNSDLIYASPKVSQVFIKALSLKGLHQTKNLALVLCAIRQCFSNINNKTIIMGLKKTKNPYRFEYLKNKNLIIDACHNPNGIKALRNNLDYFYPNQNRRFIFGCLKRKDYKKMMKILFRQSDEIFLYGFEYPNACTFEELKKACPFKAYKYTNNSCLLTDKLNIICGSFYMLKTLKNILG